MSLHNSDLFKGFAPSSQPSVFTGGSKFKSFRPNKKKERPVFGPVQGNFTPASPADLVTGKPRPTATATPTPSKPTLNIPTTQPTVAKPTVTTPSPTAPTTATPTPTIRGAVADRVGPSPRDALIERLTSAIGGIEAFDPAARFEELRAEKGLTAQGEVIGTVEQEIAKTNQLLGNLESNLKERTGDFVVPQSKFERILATERAPLIDQLSDLTTSLGVLESKFGRDEAEVITQIGLEEAKALRPLQTLATSIGLTADIATLFADDESRSREIAIVGLLSQGIDDPLQLFEFLNFDDDGNQVGDVSIGEIVDTIDLANSSDVEREALELDKLRAQIDKITDPLDRQLKEAQIGKLVAERAKIMQATSGAGAGGFDVGGATFTKTGRLTAQEEQKVQVLHSGLNLVAQVERLYYNAVGEEVESGTASRVKGIFRAISPIATDTNFNIYQRFLDSNRAPVAKGLKGEVGNLTEEEQKQALKSFPGKFSSPKEARAAFTEIRIQITDNLNTLGSFDGTPVFGVEDLEGDFESFITEE